MPRSLLTLLRRRLFWLTLLLTVWLLCSGQAPAGALALTGQGQSLGDRLAAFPQWGTKPALPAAQGDLIYPDWLQGKWQLTSTLVDLAAPRAPEVVTPGFEGNRAHLGIPVTCSVQFVAASQGAKRGPLGAAQRLIPAVAGSPQTVADRAFNGLSMARAYLGTVVQAVKVDPNNPNRQVTLLKGDRQLESTVTARAIEVPGEAEFITVERFQQVFRGGVAAPYFNEVEIITAYRRAAVASAGSGFADRVGADQVTAVYLSPQDPDFLKAPNQPVALYRYRLELVLM